MNHHEEGTETQHPSHSTLDTLQAELIASQARHKYQDKKLSRLILKSNNIIQEIKYDLKRNPITFKKSRSHQVRQINHNQT